MSICPDVRQEALAVLKNKENPFEQFARPQFADGRFRELHRPELLHQPRQLLLAMIDAYRLADFAAEKDLSPTRVVIIRGPRGAGKTHLLESLSYIDDGKPRLIVRPHSFPSDLPFEEYLLGQLHAELTAPGPLDQTPPFLRVAEQLTRCLLVQAVRFLSPVERIFARSPRRWRSLRLMFGGGEKFVAGWDSLVQSLLNAQDSRTVREIVESHGISPEHCRRIVEGHLHYFEPGSSLTATIRRDLYSATCAWSLLRDKESLLRLLEGNHASPESLSVTRSDVVTCKLKCLIESCALAGLPIVIAVDNLEKIFSPQNEADSDLIRSFVNKVAHAVDEISGLLFLVFAEDGFFTQYFVPVMMGGFGQSRWSQRISTSAGSFDAIIDLRPPTYEELHILVTSRVQQMLGDFALAHELPELFPFSPETVKVLRSEVSRSLRQSLEVLRDAYDQEVHIRKASTASLDAVLEWKKKIIKAGETLGDAWLSQRGKFHEGLGVIFSQLIGETVAGWIVRRVDASVAVGSSPALGIVTGLELEKTKTSEGSLISVAVGLLLHHAANWKPGDLQAKFDAFKNKRHKFRRLVLLWPECPDSDFKPEMLEKGSKTWKVWDDNSSYHDRTQVQLFDKQTAQAILAFPSWLELMQDGQSDQLSPEQVREFVLEHCRSVLDAVLPSAQAMEAAVI